MRPTLSTRKPVDRLTVADLETFPVWEFATDDEGIKGMDETWVKPIPTTEIPTDGVAISVASVFKLNCGLVYPGLIGCDTFAEFAVTAVVLLTVQGRVLFLERERPEFEGLGLRYDEVFPLQYSTRVPLASTGLLARGVFAIPPSGGEGGAA
jgi:hypothetical protein